MKQYPLKWICVFMWLDSSHVKITDIIHRDISVVYLLILGQASCFLCWQLWIKLYKHSFLCVCVCTCTRMHACSCPQSLSHFWLFATPWTVARQVPLSMEFSRQEYWSRFPFPSSEDLDPGIELASPESPALVGGFFYHWATPCRKIN